MDSVTNSWRSLTTAPDSSGMGACLAGSQTLMARAILCARAQDRGASHWFSTKNDTCLPKTILVYQKWRHQWTYGSELEQSPSNIPSVWLTAYTSFHGPHVLFLIRAQQVPVREEDSVRFLLIYEDSGIENEDASLDKWRFWDDQVQLVRDL